MKFPPLLAAPLRMTPLFVIERAARLMFNRVANAHPQMFDRLGEHMTKRFAFIPTDLPLGFIVEPARRHIVTFRTPAQPVPISGVDASVEGPLFLLLALLEGRCDADALFFSRDLTVTGDMEAMLALRNTLDDCNVDLPTDLGAMAGPFGPLISQMASHMRKRALSGEAGTWN